MANIKEMFIAVNDTNGLFIGVLKGKDKKDIRKKAKKINKFYMIHGQGFLERIYISKPKVKE